jgi:PhzF family phenazine biosynthesis protein
VQTLAFRQLDVFSALPLAGNPLAVVIAADDLSDAQMAAFARWTNLSETTFLLRPTNLSADYRVRIFTTVRELPFAGHPTLGSCHAWLAAGGVPQADEVIQECEAGLIRIRRDGTRLAFAAPALIRSGEIDEQTLERILRALRITADDVVAAQWVDNGPGWAALLLHDRSAVLDLVPDLVELAGINLGVIARWGGEADFEVRAFVPGDGMAEDPVTGSLNAGLAQWLIGAGLAPDTYVASQGTVLGRAGRVYVEKRGDDIWVGGESVSRIEGTLTL